MTIEMGLAGFRLRTSDVGVSPCDNRNLLFYFYSHSPTSDVGVSLSVCVYD